MTEYVKKSDVLELLSLPKDLIAEYACDLKGVWIDDDVAEQTEPQTYITEDRDTQILDAWQVHHRNTTSIEDEPQTERSE